MQCEICDNMFQQDVPTIEEWLCDTIAVFRICFTFSSFFGASLFEGIVANANSGRRKSIYHYPFGSGRNINPTKDRDLYHALLASDLKQSSTTSIEH